MRTRTPAATMAALMLWFVIGSGFSILRAEEHSDPNLEALTTGFWLRSYALPEFYSTISVGIGTRDARASSQKLENSLSALGARRVIIDPAVTAHAFMGGFWPVDGQTVWEIPTSKAKEAESALRRQPGFNYIKSRATPSPYVELKFKHDGLLREANAHDEVITSTALRLFLEAELMSINKLLWTDHLSSSSIGIFVTIAEPLKSPPVVDAPSGRLRAQRTIFARNDPAVGEIHLSSAPDNFPFGYWIRTTPVGQARTEASLVIDTLPRPGKVSPEIVDAIKNKALHLGASLYASEGEFLQFPSWQEFNVDWPPLYFTVPAAKLDLFRDKLAPGAQLLYWERRMDSEAAYAAAHQKRALLIVERGRLEKTLESTPLIRALLDSEIDRLKPPEDEFESRKGTATLRVILAARRNK